MLSAIARIDAPVDQARRLAELVGHRDPGVGSHRGSCSRYSRPIRSPRPSRPLWAGGPASAGDYVGAAPTGRGRDQRHANQNQVDHQANRGGRSPNSRAGYRSEPASTPRRQRRRRASQDRRGHREGGGGLGRYRSGPSPNELSRADGPHGGHRPRGTRSKRRRRAAMRWPPSRGPPVDAGRSPPPDDHPG